MVRDITIFSSNNEQRRNKEQKELTIVSAHFPTLLHALRMELTALVIGLGAQGAVSGAQGTLILAQGQSLMLQGHSS